MLSIQYQITLHTNHCSIFLDFQNLISKSIFSIQQAVDKRLTETFLVHAKQ